MLNRIIVFIGAMVLCSCAWSQQTKSALFLGNSYTYYNNMPQLIDNLAQDAGHDLIYDSNTPGGFQLVQHASNTASLSKIAQGNWDYVVIQAQSQEPSFPPGQVSNATYPYAAILNDSILSANPCTEPLFFMTWGRKNGDAFNCASYPPICTYDGMQQRLKESYLEMADDNDASVAPVGVAWKAVRDLYPSIELYDTDGSHPSPEGSYLAACVFYSSIFGESSIGNGYEFTLDSLTAYRLRDVASSTVIDSSAIWGLGLNDQFINLPGDTSLCGDSLNIGVSGLYYHLVWSTGETQSSSITVDSSGLYFATTTNVRGCEVSDSMNVNLNTSANSIEYLSDCDSLILNGNVFLDDTTWSLVFSDSSACDSLHTININIIHSLDMSFSLDSNSYSHIIVNAADWDSLYIRNEHGWTDNDTSNYNILWFDSYFYGYALAWNDCGKDSIHINVGFASVDELNSEWQIGPNPTSNTLLISNSENRGFAYQLIDLNGRIISFSKYKISNAQSIALDSLQSGNYILVLYDNQNVAIGKRIIQKE